MTSPTVPADHNQPAAAKHIGILTSERSFVHAYEGLGVVEEPLTPAWARRIALAFLFPSPAEGC